MEEIVVSSLFVFELLYRAPLSYHQGIIDFMTLSSFWNTRINQHCTIHLCKRNFMRSSTCIWARTPLPLSTWAIPFYLSQSLIFPELYSVSWAVMNVYISWTMLRMKHRYHFMFYNVWDLTFIKNVTVIIVNSSMYVWNNIPSFVSGNENGPQVSSILVFHLVKFGFLFRFGRLL